MKNILNFFLSIAVVLFAFIGCTSDFSDINIDPNNPTPGAVDPKYQLIIMQSRGIPYANTWQQIDQLMISTLCEYSANDPLSCSDYNVDSRYIDNLWSLSYTVLANANSLIHSNETNPLFNNVVQMTRIWKAYVMLRLTNCFGDIPYSEAANNIDQPKYDTQKDIYYQIFEELKDAVSKLDETAINNVGTYDVIYGGDAIKWKKFANSLRLRMAVRISDVDITKAKEEAQSAITAGVFENRGEAAYMTQDDGLFTQNPIYYHKNSGVLHMSTAYKRLVIGIGGKAWPTAADRMENLNITENIIAAKNAPAIVDPRAPIHFEPAGYVEQTATENMKGNWDGTDPGLVSSGVGAVMENGQFVSDFSKIGPWFYNTVDRKYPLFKYSELCLLKAIAIERGIISGNAKEAYENGVRSNMMEFGIPESVISEYLASDSPNYYGTTARFDHLEGECNTRLDKILTQKYIAQFQEGSFETWADHRQFHKPTLMPFASVNTSVFNMNPTDQINNTPNAYTKRLYYPSSEFTVNEAQVNEAVARMGGNNSIQNNVWWDID